MGRLNMAIVALALLTACLPRSQRLVPSCFVSVPPAGTATSGSTAAPNRTPQWLRLEGPVGDTTGRAALGLAGGTVIDGRWRRAGTDSLQVGGAGPFDAVWLRLSLRGDSAVGDAQVAIDDLGPAAAPAPWLGRRGQCPRD